MTQPLQSDGEKPYILSSLKALVVKLVDTLS